MQLDVKESYPMSSANFWQYDFILSTLELEKHGKKHDTEVCYSSRLVGESGVTAVCRMSHNFILLTSKDRRLH